MRHNLHLVSVLLPGLALHSDLYRLFGFTTLSERRPGSVQCRLRVRPSRVGLGLRPLQLPRHHRRHWSLQLSHCEVNEYIHPIGRG